MAGSIGFKAEEQGATDRAGDEGEEDVYAMTCVTENKRFRKQDEILSHSKAVASSKIESIGRIIIIGNVWI